MRTVKICPSTLSYGYSDYSPKALRTLFEGKIATCYMDFSFEEEDNAIDMSGAGFLSGSDYRKSIENMSISGVQEKCPAIVDNGKIRIAFSDERSTHILKPAPLDRLYLRKQIPANEHLTMQIASQVYGIDTAENGLCFTSTGQPVYITKRFDIMPDGRKRAMEDFASLIGKTETNAGDEYKYDGSYDDIANGIRRFVPASKIALEKFFRLVVFNYIFANGDAHLKNFSVIHNDGDVALAPEYDLINTAMHLDGDDFGLKNDLSPYIEKSDIYDTTGHPCRLDFERFGTHIGLRDSRIRKILDEFMNFPPKVYDLIDNSFLSDDKTRRTYKRIIEERRARFVSVSE